MANRILMATIATLLFFDSYAQTEVPHEFQPSTPARASEVNANFDALESAIDQNATDIVQIQGLSGLSREAAQIQTGLTLTSGLRWLVADGIIQQGVLPDSNVLVGAGSPTDWSNRHVVSAQVTTGAVIEIQFSVNAAPAIAGQTVLLTPVDPGSGPVWFDCSGDGLTDPFLAELDCAFADEPYAPVYDRRRMILTAFDLLAQSNAQTAVQDFYNTFTSWPIDNAQAGLADPSQYQNQYIGQLSVSNGVVNLVFGRNSHTSLQGATLFWEPTDNGASIEWKCQSIDILKILLPPECR